MVTEAHIKPTPASKVESLPSHARPSTLIERGVWSEMSGRGRQSGARPQPHVLATLGGPSDLKQLRDVQATTNPPPCAPR